VWDSITTAADHTNGTATQEEGRKHMNALHRIGTLAVSGGLVCLTAGFALAGNGTITFTETFDNGSNEGNWTFGIPEIETHQRAGGNPGWWLHSTCNGLNCLDTFAPQPRTTPMGDVNEFTGNYRERQVTNIGIDLQTLYVDFSAGGRPLTVILVSDNGNPGDFSDDWGAYYIGSENIPLVGEGWKKFDFDIPSQETELPDGWQFITFGPNAPAPDWNVLIEDVSQLRFFYGDPELFFIFQQWELGMDNPRITYVDCPAADLNCDGVVDGADLLILLGQWGECADPDDCPADLNGDGVVDGADLLILLGSWG